jgi:hypothetical protein
MAEDGLSAYCASSHSMSGPCNKSFSALKKKKKMIWEAEIGKIVIPGQPKQTVHKTPSPK